MEGDNSRTRHAYLASTAPGGCVGEGAPAAGVLRVFVKGIEAFSPLGHRNSLGYRLTDRRKFRKHFHNPL